MLFGTPAFIQEVTEDLGLFFVDLNEIVSFVDVRIDLFEQSQTFLRDINICSAPVAGAFLSFHQSLCREPVEEAGHVGVLIQHSFLDLLGRNAIGKLSAKDSQDIELLWCDAERPEEALLPVG